MILSPELERIHARLSRLYGPRADRLLDRMVMLIGRYGLDATTRKVSIPWTEHDVMLITYGDMVRAEGYNPLDSLKHFLRERLSNAFNIVHILPFYPFSSDDGFSVIDYREVNPHLGTWQDVEEIGLEIDVMFDLVLNHCSRQSEWFREFVRGTAPARNYFITMEPDTDLSMVTRPRTSPLLTKIHTVYGERFVWTTFSPDQVDLDFSNPNVLFEFLDILMFYIARGARVIRMDAIAYLWKKPGTNCIHLPETHEVVRLMRDLLEIVAPHVILLTETNVPHKENISYFGDGDEAHMVYNFSLPPLLLHAIQKGTGEVITEWLKGFEEPPKGCTFLNFTASHDGIGMRPLEGLCPAEDIPWLARRMEDLGGKVSYKRNPDGTDTPYELNITYYDSLGVPGEESTENHISRFLCTQAAMLALRGIPAVYFNSLFGARNWYEGFEETGRARTLNRQHWQRHDLDRWLNDSESREGRIWRPFLKLLSLRRTQPAFHPDASQKTLELDPRLFAFKRGSIDGEQVIACLHNMSGEDVEVSIEACDLARTDTERDFRDLVTDEPAGEGPIRLGPWQYRWISLLRGQL